MDLAGQEGARGQDHGRGFEAQPGLGNHPTHAVAFGGTVVDDQIVHCRLEHGQVGLRFDDAADRAAVQVAVCLAAGGPHRRPLGGIEGAPLDAGQVRRLGHRPAQCVDLLDQVPLADPTDGRVAAHRAHGLDVVGQQQRACTGAGSRQRRLGAGVAATNHDDVVAIEGVGHGRGPEAGGRPAAANVAAEGRFAVLTREICDSSHIIEHWHSSWHVSCGYPHCTRRGIATWAQGWNWNRGQPRVRWGSVRAGSRGTAGP